MRAPMIHGRGFTLDELKYKAPWSTTLVVVSAAATILCLGISLTMAVSGHALLCWVGLLPLAIILGAAPFTIRGYTITADAILVHRLLWATRLPLQGLQSASAEPDAMRGSLRTFGNGGLFSFSGHYSEQASRAPTGRW